jgi:hypothetical protein
MVQYTLAFDQSDGVDSQQLGGKCASLVALTAAGIPVPPDQAERERSNRSTNSFRFLILAYVLRLGEALHRELKSDGITVTALCPGMSVIREKGFSHGGSLGRPHAFI